MAKSRKPKPPRTPDELAMDQELARAAAAEWYRAVLMRDAERVRREAERLHRESEQLGRESECVNRDAERVNRESERVSREVARLRREADRLKHDMEGLRATEVRFLLAVNPYPEGCDPWTSHLQARPTDRGLLGAFADWLDEQTGCVTPKSAALRALSGSQ